jgi:predicted MFS family arabinose efflux permease
LGARLFDSTNAVLAGIGIVALGTTAAISQLLLGRTPAWLSACLGSVALALGVIVVVVATAVESGAAYLVGWAMCGVGFGIGFLGALRGLVGAIPAGHRAAVMSAFYIVAYAAISVPAVLAGLVVADLGLQTTFEVFGVIVVVIAFVAAVVAWRTRPTPHPAR